MSAYAIVVFAFLIGANGVRNLIGLPAYFVTAGVLTVAGVVMFLRLKPERFRWYRLPAPLYWFLALAVASIAWSAYRFESLLGVLCQLATTVVAVGLAHTLSWQEFLRTLGTALRYVIGLSLLFEVWVAVFVQHPVLPWWLSQPDGEELQLLYWSRDLLFSGGPIQGIVGSSVILGFTALLALIIWGVQLRAGLVRGFSGWFWMAVAVAMLLLTRSATVWIALAAVIVALGFTMWARRIGPEQRRPLYFTGTLVILGASAVAVFAREWVFGLLGKSSDITGRLEIWSKVWDRTTEHFWFGWGWVSYWPTWVEPFASLDMKDGLPVPSAHNAWFDVWFQLGLIGLLAFAALVFLTLWHTWFRAVDQPRRGPGPALPYATSAIWPWLVLTALCIQSIAESRLLVESGWLLLVMIAVKTRVDYELPTRDTEPVRVPWRAVPIARDARGETQSLGGFTAPIRTVRRAGQR